MKDDPLMNNLLGVFIIRVRLLADVLETTRGPSPALGSAAGATHIKNLLNMRKAFKINEIPDSRYNSLYYCKQGLTKTV